MTDIGWTLRRLSAMSAGEIAHRARVAARDRLLPPAWSRWSATEAAARLYRRRGARGNGAHGFQLERLRAWLHAPQDAAGLESVIRASRDLMNGRWSLFGHPVTLDDPPRWNRNPLTAAEWPDVPSVRLDH